MNKYPKGWEKQEGYLVKVFDFENFVEAVSFVNKIVPLAEEMGHHPDIDIFSYNKVKVKLTTHDKENQITKKDVTLADKINAINL